eukprot:6348156-Prorocentrum_lima.AAC.1
MTSSLVGSEMCIRDSPLPLPLPLPRLTLPTYLTTHPPTYLPTYYKLPVSYTHLTLPTICSV